MLRGRCRSCHQPISWLYPFIEIITAISLLALYYTVPLIYFPALFLFFSALMVTIRSDIETMYISQYMTVWLVPIGLLAALCGLLPISIYESIIGSFFGYFFLWSVAQGFTYFTGKDGMGEGDFELLAMIGAFTGILGCWMSIMIGSFTGSFIAMGYLLITKQPNPRAVQIPFGPFLALGAIIFVLAQSQITTFFS